MPAIDADPFERFHQAWFAGPLELFGSRCAPLNLGHLQYLAALDSPLCKLGAADVSLTIPDFLSAIRILRDARWPFTQPIDFALTASDETLLESHLTAKAAGQDSPVEDALNDLFLPWWFACQTGPELLDTEKSGRAMTAPTALGFAVRLMRAGFSERRVWTMPLGTLRFYAAAIAEQEGGNVQFVTPELVDAMKRAEAQPDLSKMPEDELYEVVKKERGEEFADAWLARRKLRAEAIARGEPVPKLPIPPPERKERK